MTAALHCPKCGVALPADAPRGLCGRCLLGLAFAVPLTAADSSPAGTPAAGRWFGGYELLEEIARGGMGVVWRARQAGLNRTVALKLLRVGSSASEADLARFRTEAEAAAILQHPHIVPVYEVGEHEGQPFLAMQLIEGGSLAEASRKAGQDGPAPPFDLRRSASLIAQVAHAVHHAHQHGILHRDLKPSNILIDAEGRAHVTDFGLAKRLVGVPPSGGPGRSKEDPDRLKPALQPDLTLSGAVLGTPSYMAPEQALGKTRELTTAVDVYGLGAILYELLTGRPPFQAASVVETLRQVVEQEPVPPSKVERPGEVRFARGDRDLETVCLKCLEKDPRRRYGSAEGLAVDLERWLRHESILARRATAWERVAKWTRRRPAVAALAVTAVLLFLVGLSGILWQSRVANRNARRAEQSASESRERSRRLVVATGFQHLNTGDSFAALLWFTEALRLDEGRADREANHRLRLASVQAQAPKLEHLWFPGGLVRHAEFSPDGTRLLLISDGEGARVFDVASGRPLTPPLPHDGQGVKARFLADGRRVFTVGGGTARLFSSDDGRLLWSDTNAVAAADLSPDGEWMVFSRHRGDLHLLHRTGGTVRTAQPPPNQTVQNIRYSPDGRRVLLLNHLGDEQVWDAVVLRSLTPKIRRPIILRDERIVLAPFDGRRVVMANGDRSIQILDAGTGESVGPSLTPREPAQHAVLSADGRWVATSTLDVVRIWDAATGQLAGLLPRPSIVITASPFSPDGSRIVTHSAQSGEEVRVWDVATARPLTPPLRHGGLITVTVFHPDGRRLVTAGMDGTARLWNLLPAHHSFRPWADENVIIIPVQSSRATLLTQHAGHQLRLWDTRTWQARPVPILETNAIVTAAITPDEQRLLVVSERGNHPNRFLHFAFVDRDRGARDAGANRTFSVHVEPRWNLFRRVWVSPDCTQAAITWDARLEFYDLATGQRRRGPETRAEGQARGAVAFSPDSRTAAFGRGRDLHVIDAASGQSLFPPLPHDGDVQSVAFSPDGLRLASGSGDTQAAPCLARVWDARTGRPITPPLLHRDGVTHVAFSPDGRVVATAHEDDVARLWDATTGQPVTPPLRHAEREVHRVVFSPDGRRLATTSTDAALQLWDALTGEPLTPPFPRSPNSSDIRLGEEIQFLGDGDVVLTVNGGRPRLHLLPSDPRPIADLRLYAQLLSGHRLDATGAREPLPLPILSNAWQTLRAKYPASFAPAAQR